MDVLFELYKMPEGQGMPWVGFMVVLLKRLLDSEYIVFVAPKSGVFIGSLNTSPGVIGNSGDCL